MADFKERRNDEQYRNEREAELGELFADALTRIEAGETVDVILAACPTEHRAHLRSMLLVGEVLFAQQQMPIPKRSEARRAATRREFLQQAAEVRAQLLPEPASAAVVATITPAPAPLPMPAPAGTRPGHGFSFGQWISGAWNRIQEATTVRGYSLAPMLATLLIAFIASLTTAQVTQAAVPGDLTYPVKNWARSAEMVLTPPDLRELVAERRKREVEQEIATVAQENEQRTEADLNRLVVQATFTLPFGGFSGRTLKFGDLTVFPSYQPNANDLVTRNPMRIDGDLVEGAMVELTVLILPGSTDYVQGAYAKVISPPPPPEAPPGAPPVSTRPAVPTCIPSRPAGWSTYIVRPNDTISRLAGLVNVGIRTISQANCFDSEFIISGQVIYLPPFIAPTVVPPVETATPTLPPQETPTAEPTASETPVASTAEPSATSEQTVEPTAQPTETALPSPTTTPAPTQEATTEPIATSTPTETAEPGSTPTATDQPTATAPAATPQITATPTASATAEGAVTAEATTAPNAEITPTEPQAEATATAVGQEPTRAPPTATLAATTPPTVESAINTPASKPTAETTAPQPVAPTDIPTLAPTSPPPPAQPPPTQPPSAPPADAGGASTGGADNGQAGENSAAQP